MITLNPDTITYIGVSDTYASGEVTQTETPVTGIGCSVQSSNGSYIKGENGDNIAYSFLIMVTKSTEIDKVPTFNINDKVTIDSKEYKVLKSISYQKHIEIYAG